jgi:hypothetical protein
MVLLEPKGLLFWCLSSPYDGFLPSLLSGPEDEGTLLIRNVGISPNYTALQPLTTTPHVAS